MRTRHRLKRRRRPGQRRGIAAFTLIELMITVSIIAVISSLAVPEYRRFLCKSKQSEAVYLIKSVRDFLESQRTEHGYLAYSGELGCNGVDTFNNPSGSQHAARVDIDQDDNRVYSIEYETRADDDERYFIQITGCAGSINFGDVFRVTGHNTVEVASNSCL